uniref:Uncharacterized protein n=1 Tax=Streptomyces sp. NBC_01393 TaxID=2903851 RepID=A0AAU3IA22_9ACTN
MSEPKPRLRKVETREDARAVDTYEVLAGKEVRGTITKYIEMTYRQQKNGQVRGRAVTSWAWHRRGRTDDLRYVLQRDAIDRLLRAAREGK